MPQQKTFLLREEESLIIDTADRNKFSNSKSALIALLHAISFKESYLRGKETKQNKKQEENKEKQNSWVKNIAICNILGTV